MPSIIRDNTVVEVKESEYGPILEKCKLNIKMDSYSHFRSSIYPGIATFLVNTIMQITKNSKKVEVKFEIRSFTQKIIEVPVEVKNLPIDGQVRLFPEKVKVTMNISQEDYDLISVKDFKCVANFKELDAEQSRVSLSLEKIPDHIELIDWGQKSAEFIIIKK